MSLLGMSFSGEDFPWGFIFLAAIVGILGALVRMLIKD